MLVYRSGNPTSRRKSLGYTTTNKWVGSFFLRWSIDVFVHFLIFVISLKTIFWALAFIEVPPQLRKAQQTLPLLQVFRIFSHHFPFEKDACQNSSSSPFPDGIHEDKFEDWTRKNEEENAVGEDKKFVEIAARIFGTSFSYNFFVLFTFPVWNQTKRHFVTMEIVPLWWKLFLLHALIPIPVYKPE